MAMIKVLMTVWRKITSITDIYKGDNMKDKIYKTIYNWVEDNFGQSEADDPSWSIHDLAEYIEKHFHELYWQQELEYLKEDVEYYAGENDYKMTEQQMYRVADKIRNSEWYCSINPEDMEYYIKEELKKEG